MKKDYLDPEFNIVWFDAYDVIATSGDPGGFEFEESDFIGDDEELD